MQSTKTTALTMTSNKKKKKKKRNHYSFHLFYITIKQFILIEIYSVAYQTTKKKLFSNFDCKLKDLIKINFINKNSNSCANCMCVYVCNVLFVYWGGVC